MQVTIDIEPQTYSLLQKVKDKGVSLDEVLRDALDRFDGDEHPQNRMTGEEWVKSLRNWATEPRNLPHLPDEALRRENIYGERD